MKRLLIITLALLACYSSSAQRDRAAEASTLALTPPMGWNSWNFFEDEISDAILREMADVMVENGMVEAGYQYILIDDLWVGGRDRHNKLYPDPVRFPNGIKPLADYIHSKGLKLGIYSTAAPLTCAGVTGSLGFEELDAQTFADWGIDYLKYDYCGAPADVETAFVRYKAMGDAIRKTGRPMVYAICEWGPRRPWLWARAAGGNLWRTTWDSRDVWQSNDANLTGVMEIFDQQDGLEQYAGPGGWNDPDLLMVGLNGKGKSSSVDGKFKGCTADEYRSHFALWCMLAAPLVVNNDLRNSDPEIIKLLTNKHLIGIDQDSLGRQGYTVMRTEDLQILRRELSGGDVAICIFNRSDKPVAYNFDPSKDWKLYPQTSVVNAWSGSQTKKSAAKGTLAPHASEVLIYK